jgi:glycosyltransferase involved in cell wall biosynthesis
VNIHIISQPHTQLTAEYLRCAYTQKVIKLCRMLVKEGMNVIVYAGEENETPAELVTCITKTTLRVFGFNGPEDYCKNRFNPDDGIWKVFHALCIENLKQRVESGDIIGTFSGVADKAIAEAFPQCSFVELGIGYTGVFADYRVYESYAWMHMLLSQSGASSSDGKFYHTVIPNYFDPEDFSFGSAENYFLFVGRTIWRKGIKIVADIAKRLPQYKFIFAGQGARQFDNSIVCDDGTIIIGDNLEYIGTVDAKKRDDLMSHAKALICPTLYVGPFEGVHVESMMCGTPVITTPWGAFTETFTHGVHGYRCHTIKSFVEACLAVHTLDRLVIREYAQSRYSMNVVAKQYIEYFNLLDGINKGGFYE